MSINGKFNEFKAYLHVNINWLYTIIFEFPWYRVATLLLIIQIHFLKMDIRDLNNENLILKKTNIELLAVSQKNSKIINELPNPFWKKWYNPQDESITMITYNDSFYEQLLKGLGLKRFFYIGKTDFIVFDFEQANRFYQEDLGLVKEFINGDGAPVIREYDTEWTEIDGTVNKNGYRRWVMRVDDNIYVYGLLNSPKNKR